MLSLLVTVHLYQYHYPIIVSPIILAFLRKQLFRTLRLVVDHFYWGSN